MKKLYKDFYYKVEGENHIFCYRTGLTVYEEVFEGKRLLSGGFNAAGYTQDVLGCFPNRLPRDSYAKSSVLGFDINGESQEYDLEYVGHTQKKETNENNIEIIHVEVTLKCILSDTIIIVHTILDGTPVLVRYLEIINNSNQSVALGSLVPFGGLLEKVVSWDRYQNIPNVEDLFSVGYMQRAAQCCEGIFGWKKLSAGGTSIYGKYESGGYRHPAFFLRDNLFGGIYTCQLAYSGGYEFKFNLSAEEEKIGGGDSGLQTALLGMEVKISSPNPQWILSSKESYSTPQVHITKMFGDLDEAINAMHDHVRKSVFTFPLPQGKLGVLAAGMGPEHPMDIEGTKFFIDTAKKLGVEIFTIDAGWYCPPGTQAKEWHMRLGDWTPDKDRYPNGIKEIIDYTHEQGLMFGIWMDCEHLGSLSKVYSEHPDWLCESYFYDKKTPLIDLTNPEAARWMEEEVARILELTNADLFRLDHNFGLDECFSKVEKDGKRYCSTLDYYKSLYEIYNNLRRRFPNVLFENCAAGGKRTDLGIMKYFNHTWVSDWQVAPSSFAITNGMTMVLPPEYVDRLASGMNCHTKASLDFQIRQTLFGKPTTNSYNSQYSNYNEMQIEFAKHTYDIYKDFVRPYAKDAKIYHHTPEIDCAGTQGIGILERASADRSKSMIGVFKLANNLENPPVIYPRGIRADGEYLVKFDNLTNSDPDYKGGVVSGYDLCNNGLRVNLKGSMISELILIEKIK